MCHPLLAADPNTLQLLRIGFEVRGHGIDRNVMQVLIPEYAELGNLAEVVETAKGQGRPLDFDQKPIVSILISASLQRAQILQCQTSG